MKVRESNIELLRIVAACSVVFSHMFPIITKSLIDAELMGGGNWFVSKVLLSFSVCAVNVFILITGYFSCHSQNRTIGKPLNLILLMIAVNMLSYIIQIIAGVQILSMKGLLVYGMPVNYFVTLFIVLYVVSPYINICINRLSDAGMTRFVVIIFLLFSICPSLVDIIEDIIGKSINGISPIGRLGSQSGYNIVNFILVYCVGALLGRNKIKDIIVQHKYSPVIVMLGSIAAIFVWQLFSHSALNYHNPFVIILAASTFLTFSQIHFSSKFVNELAKAAFAVFLLHVHIIHHIHIDYFSKLSPVAFMLFVIVAIALIYIVSYVAWKVYDLITKPVFKELNQVKIPYIFD